MTYKKRYPITAKRLALTAMFAAVSYGLSFLEFPVFPAAPFLKLDFSFSMQLIGAYILGPLLGEAIVLIVQLLRLLSSSTGGIGELANFIAATCFVCVPSLLYSFRKGLPMVFLSMAAGTALQIGASLLSNRFLTFPLYMGSGAKSAFESFFGIIVAFNAIKCLANAAITFLLYKRLKRVFFPAAPSDRLPKETSTNRDHILRFLGKLRVKGEALPDYSIDFGNKLRKK